MTQATWLALAALTSLVAPGCGKSAEVRSPDAANQVQGAIADFAITVRDAVVLRQRRGGQELMVLVLTDLHDACGAIVDGALRPQLFEPRQHRKGSRFVAWSVFSGEDGAIAAGPVELALPDFEGRSPLPARGSGPYGFPMLGASDDQCDTHYARIDYRAATAALELVDVPAGDGPVTGRFTLSYGGSELTGSFSARQCAIPEGTPSRPPAECVADPAEPRKSPADMAAAARFVPLGPPIGRAWACWRAELACRVAPGATAEIERLEVARIVAVKKVPTGAQPFPPPATAKPTFGDVDEHYYWISATRRDGEGGGVVERIGRETRPDGAEVVVFEGDESRLEVPIGAASGGETTALYRPRGGAEIPLSCVVPPNAGADAARWTYADEPGVCP